MVPAPIMIQSKVQKVKLSIWKNDTKIDRRFVTADGYTRFCWSDSQQGLLKSAFFWGYLVLQIHGGTLAEKYGTKRVLGLALLITAILTLLTPLIAKWNIWALFVSRILIGIAEAVTYPSLPPLVQKWVPESEKSKFISFTYTGGNLGTVVTYPLCGWILSNLDWEAVFYITGGFSVLWFVLWYLVVTDDPRGQKCIKSQEIEWIEKSRTDTVKTDVLPPYFEILKSPAVWTFILCDFANGWGLYTILTEGPNFISNVLHQDIANNGLLNALPHLAALLMSFVLGSLSDWILIKGYLTESANFKLFEILGLAGVGLALALMGFFTENYLICVSILTIGFSLRGALYSGHIKAIMKLSPNFSGTVFGYSNGLGSVSGIFTPIVTAALTESDKSDPVNWRYVFLIATGIEAVALLNFLVNAKFTAQPFDEIAMKNVKESNEIKV